MTASEVTQAELATWACALLNAAADGRDDVAAHGLILWGHNHSEHDLELLAGTLLVVGSELLKMLAESLSRPFPEILKAAVASANESAT